LAVANKDPGLISAALGYDLLVQLITGGRERRMREGLAAIAKLRPGERVLDADAEPARSRWLRRSSSARRASCAAAMRPRR